MAGWLKLWAVNASMDDSEAVLCEQVSTASHWFGARELEAIRFELPNTSKYVSVDDTFCAEEASNGTRVSEWAFLDRKNYFALYNLWRGCRRPGEMFFEWVCDRVSSLTTLVISPQDSHWGANANIYFSEYDDPVTRLKHREECVMSWAICDANKISEHVSASKGAIFLSSQRLGDNPFIQEFERPAITVFFQYILPALYFGAAFVALFGLRLRKKKIRVHPASTLVLLINFIDCVLIGTYLRFNGYGTATKDPMGGHVTVYMIFLLTTSSLACDVMIIMMWENTISSSKHGMRVSLSLKSFVRNPKDVRLMSIAVALLGFEILTALQMMERLISMQYMVEYTIFVALPFICTLFISFVLLRTSAVLFFQTKAMQASGLNTTEIVQVRFKTFLTRIAYAGGLSALSSLTMMSALIAGGLFNVLYATPTGYVVIGAIVTLSRFCSASAQILFCFPPKQHWRAAPTFFSISTSSVTPSEA